MASAKYALSASRLRFSNGSTAMLFSGIFALAVNSVLAAEEEPRQAEVVDLMERLRQSLGQAGPAKAPRGKAAKGARKQEKKTPAKRRARPAA